MEIEIINTELSIEKEDTSLESTKYFGLILLKTLLIIKMLHWYTDNLNVHEVLGNLYNILDDLFDKLQEEIIGNVQLKNALFPGFSPDSINIEELSQYDSDISSILDSYNKNLTLLTAYISSPEFNNFINSISSGLNNTKEDILSSINKSSYLLNKIK